MRAVALLAALLAARCPLAQGEETLVIGYPLTRQHGLQLDALTPYLESRMPGVRVRIEALRYQDLDERLASHRIDFLATQPAHYRQEAQRHHLSTPLVSIIERTDNAPLEAVGGAIVSAAGRGELNRLQDLRGKRIASPGARSFAAYQLQMGELQRVGIGADDIELVAIGQGEEALAAIKDGRADVAFVRAGLIEWMSARGSIDRAAFKFINPQTLPAYPVTSSTHLYPPHLIAALPHVAEQRVRDITTALLALPHDGAIARQSGLWGFSVAADYAAVDALLQQLQLPPFDRPAAFSLLDIGAPLLAVIAGGLTLLLLGGLIGHLLRERRRLNAAIALSREFTDQLRDSERHYREALDAVEDGMWSWNISDGTVAWDQRCWALAGYADIPDDRGMTHGRWMTLLHPADARKAIERIGEAVKARRSFAVEYRLQQTSGHWIWLEQRGQVVEWSDGAPCRAVGALSDISLRKQTELALKKSERHLRSLIAAMQEVVLVIDTEMRLAELHVPAEVRRPGVDADRLIGLQVDQLFGDDDRNRLLAITSDILIDGRPRTLAIDLPFVNEGRRYQLSLSRLEDGANWLIGFLGVARDVTELVEAEAAARRAHEDKARLLDAAGEGIFGLDLNGRCTFINPAALAMLGWRREEVIGHDAHALFHAWRADGAPNPRSESPLDATLRDGQARHVEDWFRRQNGEGFPVQLIVTPVREDGRQTGVEVLFQDIATRRRLEAELTRLANSDPLTGLANRRIFFERLEHERQRVRRINGPATGLLMLDLDHFKPLNDRHGHAVGDAVLRQVAELIRAGIRGIDLAARYGGDEIVVLLPGVDAANANQTAERLRGLLNAQPLSIGTSSVAVTASFGVTLLEPNDPSTDAAMARVDAALYRAKANGRDGCVCSLSDPVG